MVLGFHYIGDLGQIKDHDWRNYMEFSHLFVRKGQTLNFMAQFVKKRIVGNFLKLACLYSPYFVSSVFAFRSLIFLLCFNKGHSK